MGENKPNPDSVTLEDVQRMRAGEFRVFSYLMLSKLDSRTKCIENRLWAVLTSVIILGLTAILAALLG